MKLCLLNYEYPPIGAGAATATEATARALVRLGHEVVVVTSALGKSGGWSEECGIHVLRMNTGRKRADACSVSEMAAFGALASLRLASVVREHRCEGVIAFFSFPSGPAAWWTARLRGVPYVISLRGGDVPGTEPGLKWMHCVLRPLRRMILRGARAVVANSQGLAALSLAADPIPVRVIANGVDADTFSPYEGGRTADDAFRVVAVGRLQDQKNHTFGLRIIADCVAVTRRRVEYHIVGDGPLRRRLESEATALGISENISWHGWLPREEIPRLLRRCDVMLHPTLYEGMPNAVLECLACGLPAVASDIAGNQDVIRDGATGWLLPLGEPEGYVEKLRLLAEDDRLRARMGTAARAHVREHFSWEAVARSYVNLFEH